MAGRILLVEDEAAVASSLKVVLETRGYTVVTAASTAQGTAALRFDTFDLVVTDMKMETTSSGYEVVRIAHSQPYQPMIMILTAFPILGQQWRTAGAHAMVSKPVATEELLRVVARLLALRPTRSRKRG